MDFNEIPLFGQIILNNNNIILEEKIIFINEFLYNYCYNDNYSNLVYGSNIIFIKIDGIFKYNGFTKLIPKESNELIIVPIFEYIIINNKLNKILNRC